MLSKPSGIIALITDFGLTDPYVGQLKGALFTKCLKANIVDISHEIPPFNVKKAAFFVSASYKHFPSGTAFLVVVDPEVGSSRELILLANKNYCFISPNNGVLSLIIREENCQEDWRAYKIKIPHAKKGHSFTFAARDVMAPIAAKILKKESISNQISEFDMSLFVKPLWSTTLIENNIIRTSPLHVDHFGNIILALSYELWQKAGWEVYMGTEQESSFQQNIFPALHSHSPHAVLRPASHAATHLFSLCLCYNKKKYPLMAARSYVHLPKGILGLVMGSQGHMEICMNMQKASAFLEYNEDESNDFCFEIIKKGDPYHEK